MIMPAKDPLPAPPRPVQLTLDLPFQEAMRRADFIESPANAAALRFIEAWPDWPGNIALLTGPAGAGKTHLATIWAEKSGAQRHFAKALCFDRIEPWLQTGALVIEDVGGDQIDETALFHLLNTVRTEGGALLITAQNPLSRWHLSIADLISRLRAAISVEIGAPDDILLAEVYRKQFQDRQIAVDPAVIDYLLPRVERSLTAAREIVASLDRASSSRRRPITKRLASEILEF